jgi:hypothetical protein
MLTSGVVLLHNNARPHTASRTRGQQEHSDWEFLTAHLASLICFPT